MIKKIIDNIKEIALIAFALGAAIFIFIFHRRGRKLEELTTEILKDKRKKALEKSEEKLNEHKKIVEDRTIDYFAARNKYLERKRKLEEQLRRIKRDS